MVSFTALLKVTLCLITMTIGNLLATCACTLGSFDRMTEYEVICLLLLHLW